MVITWMLNSDSHVIQGSVVYPNTAKEFWNDLAVRFSQGNAPKKINLKKDLVALTQGTLSIYVSLFYQI